MSLLGDNISSTRISGAYSRNGDEVENSGTERSSAHCLFYLANMILGQVVPMKANCSVRSFRAKPGRTTLHRFLVLGTLA